MVESSQGRHHHWRVSVNFAHLVCRFRVQQNGPWFWPPSSFRMSKSQPNSLFPPQTTEQPNVWCQTTFAYLSFPIIRNVTGNMSRLSVWSRSLWWLLSGSRWPGFRPLIPFFNDTPENSFSNGTSSFRHRELFSIPFPKGSDFIVSHGMLDPRHYQLVQQNAITKEHFNHGTTRVILIPSQAEPIITFGSSRNCRRWRGLPDQNDGMVAAIKADYVGHLKLPEGCSDIMSQFSHFLEGSVVLLLATDGQLWSHGCC